MGRHLARVARTVCAGIHPTKSCLEASKVIRAATAANLEAGRTVPETLSTATLKRAVGVIKIAALATRAGIPVQTIHSKVRKI